MQCTTMFIISHLIPMHTTMLIISNAVHNDAYINEQFYYNKWHNYAYHKEFHSNA